MPTDAAQIRQIAADRGLAPCMNDTKWRELCEAFRQRLHSPRFRIRDLLAAEGHVSDWDREWHYHPRPYLSIEWLEVELPAEQIPAALEMCRQNGVAVERCEVGLRIFGWRGSERGAEE